MAKDILYSYINDLLDMVVASTAGSEFMQGEEGKAYMAGITESRRQVNRMKSDNFEELSRYVDLIRETCEEESIALLIVTHSMEVAEQFTRVVRLEEVNLVARQAQSKAPSAESA